MSIVCKTSWETDKYWRWWKLRKKKVGCTTLDSRRKREVRGLTRATKGKREFARLISKSLSWPFLSNPHWKSGQHKRHPTHLSLSHLFITIYSLTWIFYLPKDLENQFWLVPVHLSLSINQLKLVEERYGPHLSIDSNKPLPFVWPSFDSRVSELKIERKWWNA